MEFIIYYAHSTHMQANVSKYLIQVNRFKNIEILSIEIINWIVDKQFNRKHDIAFEQVVNENAFNTHDESFMLVALVVVDEIFLF